MEDLRSFVCKRELRVGCNHKNVDSWVCTMDHCYSAYPVTEDGTEEYQDYTLNSDAACLCLDSESPYQRKGVYQQRQKFLGSLSFYFGITGVIFMHL